jgi:hypothetical protein
LRVHADQKFKKTHGDVDIEHEVEFIRDCFRNTSFLPVSSLGTESREEMTLDSKRQEEVKKRRSKPSALNLYQRLVLLAGAAVLVFAVWTIPASLPAVGVIGTTLLIFFVLKDSREKQDKGKRVDSKEPLLEAGENIALGEKLPEAGENVDLQEMLSEVGKNVDREILAEPEEKERAEKVV